MNTLTMTLPQPTPPSRLGLLKAREGGTRTEANAGKQASAEAETSVTDAGKSPEGLLPVVRVLELAAEAIHRFVYFRAGGDAALVDDVMQQLWLAARKGSPMPRGTAEAWLRGAARNIIADHWRGVARRPVNLPLPDLALASDLAERMTDPAVPLELLGRVEARNQLFLALTELESADQDLLVRFYFSGHSQARLATEMNLSERAIEGRLYRARQALRKKLERLEESGFGEQD